MPPLPAAVPDVFVQKAPEPQCTDLTYSEDGNVWYSLSAGVPFTPVLSDNWKWFKFKRTVKARYIRVYVGRVTGHTSMNEAEKLKEQGY